jgi:hypothetical protein
MCKGSWSDCPQVRHIRFLSIPELKRCYFSRTWNNPVLDIRCTQRTARPQSSSGTFFPYIWLRADSNTVLFTLSATPFSWGV